MLTIKKFFENIFGREEYFENNPKLYKNFLFGLAPVQNSLSFIQSEIIISDRHGIRPGFFWSRIPNPSFSSKYSQSSKFSNKKNYLVYDLILYISNPSSTSKIPFFFKPHNPSKSPHFLPKYSNLFNFHPACFYFPLIYLFFFKNLFKNYNQFKPIYFPSPYFSLQNIPSHQISLKKPPISSTTKKRRESILSL
ncbi:unnamed protein product [Meloidogyne enterolobii]|uniref:Uncharacterized protein n=1 Tax=Meloidogyne enterolobii TaxID=390850 RepID=A0ACB0YUK5_MELEN